MKILTDTSIMPNGKYAGVRLIDIPASYLIWIYENNRCSKDVKAYIQDNLEALRKETKL